LEHASNQLQAGNIPQACKLCLQLLTQSPKFSKALQLRQKILASSNPPCRSRDEAIGIIQSRLTQKKLKSAEKIASYYLLINPADTNMVILHAVALTQLGETGRAILSMESALSRNPDNPDLHNNLGTILSEGGRYREALEHFQAAIKQDTSLLNAYLNCAATYHRLNRTDESLRVLAEAEAIAPHNVDIVEAIATNLRVAGDEPAALERYAQVVAMAPENSAARDCLSMLQIGQQQLEEGWHNYEARFLAKPEYNWLDCDTPRWSVEIGKSDAHLLIWCEQGLGDEVYFSKLLPNLLKHVGRVTAIVDKRLLALMERSFPGVHFVAKSDWNSRDLSNFDYQCPLGSLPLALRLFEHAECLQQRGFLLPDSEFVTSLRGQMITENRQLVGLSWRSRNQASGAARSIELMALLASIAGDNINLLNLQYGDVREELAEAAGHGHRVEHCEDIDNEFDIDGLAALISACDAVITIDNTTAHLAGALGKPTLLMMPRIEADFRWQNRRLAAAWYPSVTILQQDIQGDWEPVMREASLALDALLS
jgi:tetratricopeptide (TPR) repeat protein